MNIHKEISSAPTTETAAMLGPRPGRPKGSLSSPLSIWLHDEIRQRRHDGYRCRESFNVTREAEIPDGPDAFIVTGNTVHANNLEAFTRVAWPYFKKLWRKAGATNV